MPRRRAPSIRVFVDHRHGPRIGDRRQYLRDFAGRPARARYELTIGCVSVHSALDRYTANRGVPPQTGCMMDSRKRAMIGKLLALAGSDNEAEALSALRKANAMLKAEGLSLTDVGQGFGQDVIRSTEWPEPADADQYRYEQEDCDKRDRETILNKYGSQAVILEPQEREVLIIAATSCMRGKGNFEQWINVPQEVRDELDSAVLCAFDIPRHRNCSSTTGLNRLEIPRHV